MDAYRKAKIAASIRSLDSLSNSDLANLSAILHKIGLALDNGTPNADA